MTYSERIEIFINLFVLKNNDLHPKYNHSVKKLVLKEFEEHLSQSIENCFILADKAYLEQDFDLVILYLQIINSRGYKGWTLYNNLGLAFLEKLEYKKAILNFRLALEAEENFETVENLIAVSNYLFFSLASSAFNKWSNCEDNPSSINGYLTGLEQLTISECIEKLSIAINQESNIGALYFNRARFLSELGLIEQAEIDYLKGLSYEPNNSKALFQLGEVQENKFEKEKSLIMYKNAYKNGSLDAWLKIIQLEKQEGIAIHKESIIFNFYDLTKVICLN